MPDTSRADRLSFPPRNEMKRQRDHVEIGALIALFAGALSTGGAGILVRLSETGPTAPAFWRGCIAPPLLAVWALLERPARRDSRRGPARGDSGSAGGAGGPPQGGGSARRDGESGR